MKAWARTNLMAVCGVLMCAGAAFGQAISEVEPNSLKSVANAAEFTTPGDGVIGTITGTTTNFLTGATNGGLESSDYYRVTLPASTPGIYRYQFVVTSTTLGHAATFRGFSQSAGVINTASDQTIQTTTTVTTPPRMNAVYAFGSAAQVYYRVQGTAATTAAYTSTLTRSTVTPTVLADEFKPGNITISTVFQTAQDTAFIVLDSNFQPLTATDPVTMTPMAFRNDNEMVPTLSGGTAQSSCTRTLGPGTYYIAITDMGPSGGTAFGNNEGAPGDDRWRNLAVMEHPGTLFSASTQLNVSMGVTINDGCRVRQVPLMKSGAYEVMFVQFTIGNPDIPCVALSTSVDPATQGQTVDFFANVTPAMSGATGIISVVADLSAFGGPSAAVMSNDGASNGDAAVDSIWTARLAIPTYRAGRAQWTVTATDGAARATTNSAVLTMSTVAPPNDTCATAVAIASLPYAAGFGNYQATTDSDVSCNTGSGGTIQGIWWTHTPATSSTLVLSEVSAQDVIHVVYDATGGCDALGTPILCTNTDEGAVVGINAGTPYAILVARFASSGTTIPTDNYSVRFESQSVPAPANDTCATATAMTTFPFTDLVNNAGAGDDVDVSCNDTQVAMTRNGIWYSYSSATDCYITFSETTAQDVVIGFWTGACDALTPYNCIGIETGWSILLRGGETYSILVGRYSTVVAAGVAEQIGFSVSACAAPPAAPANDLCTDATTITTVPFVDIIQMAGATHDDSVAPSCVLGTEQRHGVWYAYTPAVDCTGVLTEVAGEDTMLSVWTGACSDLTEAACFANEVAPRNQFRMTAGVRYLMLVGNTGTPQAANAGYEVRFRVIPDAPINDCPGVPITLGTTLSGNTAEATIGAITSSCSTASKDMWYTFTAPFEDFFSFECEKLDGGRATVAIYSACDSNAQINCNAGSTGVTPHTVILNHVLAAGETVFIRITAHVDLDGLYNVRVQSSSPTGACCTGATCGVVITGTCTGTYQGDGSVCIPTNPCGSTTEACCRGATCLALPSGSCSAGNSIVVASCGMGNALASCCYADFNHSGASTIDDLFLYLNAYFTGDPYANVGGDGVAAPVIDDLFLYINAYFVGCQ